MQKREWLSWLDSLGSTDPTEETLLETLEVCLSDETWAENAEETELYPFLALCWSFPALRIKIEGAMRFWPKSRRMTLLECLKPYFATNGTAPPQSDTPESFLGLLAFRVDGTPVVSVANLLLIFSHHTFWADRLWHDVVRNQPMVADRPFTDADPLRACAWLAVAMNMQTSNHRLIETCMLHVCEERPRDPLQEYITALPPWDTIPRLSYWLPIVCRLTETPYTETISRLLIVSLVARALDPGCQYRSVVILEGPENIGKSRLIAALAGPEWTVELTKGLDTKEAHMMLEGAWVAELAELDSLSKTEETKLKAFITHTHDEYVPKYQNHKTRIPRRTVFIGSTNDSHYLKGETGNSRFLPVKTSAPYDLDEFERMRLQLFAEALVYYQAHPGTWWALDEASTAFAVEARGERRIINVFEDSLRDWLASASELGGPQYPGETDLEEIGSKYLQMDRKSWANSLLQKQMTSALRALGYEPRNDRASLRNHGAMRRYWGQEESP